MSIHKKYLTSLVIVALLVTLCPITDLVEATTVASQAAHAKLPNTIALFIGNHRAILDNSFAAIDERTPLTKPIIKNARTLVPVRFISEKLGATVGWDEYSQGVAILLGDINIGMNVGSPVIYINGKRIVLDVAPIVSNGRTFVPLRAISEAFGKEVFYDRELILISDDAVLNAVKDKKLIDEIISWFRAGQVPAWQRPVQTIQQLAALDKSVVIVKALDDRFDVISQGSGFALGNNLVTTSLHVLPGAKYYSIVDYTGKSHHAVAGVVAYSEDYDLAILRTVNPIALPALPLGRLANVVKGEEIVTIGSPLGLHNTITGGLVSNIHTVEGINLIQISAALAPGSSGGPVLNMRGEVIGIAAFGIEETDFNFVVPVDYLLPLVDQFEGVYFSDIPVVELPEFELPDPGEEPGPILPTPTQLTPSQDIGLMFQPTDIALHPTEPIIYATDKGNQAVYAVNYATKEIARLDLPHMPERVVFANGEVYVTLLHREHDYYWWTEDQTGTIAIIDPATFTIVDSLEIGLDPYDIVVDKEGYIYVSSGSGQWTNLESYSRHTKEKVSSMMIRQQSYIELSPTQNRIYAVDPGSSPRDMSYYTFSSGKLLESKDSPYHGDYRMNTNFAISPDGAFVFNGAGTVFYPTLSYAGDLGHVFTDIAFNLEENELYAGALGGQINVYDYTSLELTDRLQIVGDAQRMFFRDNRLIIQRYNNGRYWISVYSL